MKRTTYTIEKNYDYDPYDALCIEIVAQGFRELILLASQYDYYKTKNLKPGDGFYLLGSRQKYKDYATEWEQYKKKIDDIMLIENYYHAITTDEKVIIEVMKEIKNNAPLFYERFGKYVTSQFDRF